jgi:2-oxoglutarate dehydrogenase E2 component (dihydrolipoamide succinyltransferase)
MPSEVKVPEVGESISEVEIADWRKSEGDPVQKDEILVILETDKATVELPAPVSGTLTQRLRAKGATAKVGETIALIDEKAAPKKAVKKAEPIPEAEPKDASAETQSRVTPAAQRLLAQNQLKVEEVTATGPGGRLLKEDVLRKMEEGPSTPASKTAAETGGTEPAKTAPPPQGSAGDRAEEIVPMSRLRRTLAERLVQAQQTAALLTTFNEIDMTAVMQLRKEYGEPFLKRYGVKLGFMSFFIKASVDALKAVPQVNAEIRDQSIVFHHYADIGVAVGGGKGLVVPVLRNAERMSFAEIELAILEFAKRAKDNQLKLEELQGGTFTISNGGIYGSLLSTPIVNPPQSGILGMHAIQDRPIALEGAVVIRPMMYIALTYDHRIVDGREAVTFLKRIKEAIETPTRLLLEV